MTQGKLKVTIVSSEKLLFQGTADAVSSWNKRGKFDILPEHANFISLIDDHITLHRTGKEPWKLRISPSVVHVKNNEVKAFIGFKEIPDE